MQVAPCAREVEHRAKTFSPLPVDQRPNLEGMNKIDLEHIARIYQELCNLADVIIVEGVGGWMVPLNETMQVSDIPRRLDLPVVLVVGMRLGCLNHAMLTDAAMRECDISCIGWVANSIVPDFSYVDDNIATLSRHISAPLLGVVEYHSPLHMPYVADAIALPRVTD